MKKKTTKTSKSLERKIKSYATIAASVVAADASSQVIYTNINDTTLANSGDFFDIDFNTDGIMDVKVVMYNLYSIGTSYAYGYFNIEARGMNSAEVNTQLNSYSYYEVTAFNNNASINGSTNSFNTSGYVGWYSFFSSTSSFSSFRSGQFPGQGQKFVGAKFNIGNNVHYGWIRLDVSMGVDSVTILDFAYDTTAGAAILAGDTGLPVGLENKAERKLEMYANENRLLIPNGLGKSSEFNIYNLKGQLIESGRIAKGQTEVALKKEYKGIYIVDLNDGEGVLRKKLWLESK